MSDKQNDELVDDIIDSTEIMYIVSSFVGGKMVFNAVRTSVVESQRAVLLACEAISHELRAILEERSA